MKISFLFLFSLWDTHICNSILSLKKISWLFSHHIFLFFIVKIILNLLSFFVFTFPFALLLTANWLSLFTPPLSVNLLHDKIQKTPFGLYLVPLPGCAWHLQIIMLLKMPLNFFFSSRHFSLIIFNRLLFLQQLLSPMFTKICFYHLFAFYSLSVGILSTPIISNAPMN